MLTWLANAWRVPELRRRGLALRAGILRRGRTGTGGSRRRRCRAADARDLGFDLGDAAAFANGRGHRIGHLRAGQGHLRHSAPGLLTGDGCCAQIEIRLRLAPSGGAGAAAFRHDLRRT